MRMNLTITMDNAEATIMRELTDPTMRGVDQASVAITYAFIMAQHGEAADWPKINAAIRKRWKGRSALARVKELAWKQLEEWRSRGQFPEAPRG